MMVRLAVIGAAVLAVALAFAGVGGWLAPHRLTQSRMVEALEDANGVHPGFRRNHAKGVCISGWFEGSGAAAAVSKAEVFQAGSHTPVIGRLALAGGMPAEVDSAGQVRSMALRLLPSAGGEWRTGMNNIPVFVSSTPQGFYEQLVAGKPDPATGKPDPAAMKAFVDRHPETVKALTLVKARPMTSGFADSAYNSLNAFRFVSSSGAVTPVRWGMEPLQPPTTEVPAAGSQPDRNYLFDALIAQIHQHALKWHLLVTLGQAGDPTDDATVPWPADRQRVNAGTLVINGVSSEDGGACTDINYDPLVLPPGIEASDDPLLSARSAAYFRSFTLRTREKAQKAPSAVTVQESRAGDKS